jgi:hypothetical protein
LIPANPRQSALKDIIRNVRGAYDQELLWTILATAKMGTTGM